MKLTPLDIKRQEFTRTFRGIDADEVQSFLQMVADQWENLLEENRRLEQQVRDLDGKLVHYRKIEEALQEALETARNNSNRTIENAQREAQIILKEAKSSAEDLRNQVRNERTKLKHDVSKILGRKDEIVARLRAFLMSEMEILARFEKQDQMGLLQIDGPSMSSLGYSPDTYEVETPERVQEPVNEPPPPPPQQQERNVRPVTQAPIPTPPPVPSHTSPVHDTEEPLFSEPEEATVPDSPANGMPADEPGTVEFDTAFGNAFTQVMADSEQSNVNEGLSSDELEYIKSTVSSAANVEEEYTDPMTLPESEFDSGAEQWQKTPDFTTGSDPFDAGSGRYHVIMPESGDEVPNPYYDAEQPDADDSLGGGWIVRPVVSPNQHIDNGGFDAGNSGILNGAADEDEVSATPEEIEKIRRILNDLD